MIAVDAADLLLRVPLCQVQNQKVETLSFPKPQKKWTGVMRESKSLPHACLADTRDLCGLPHQRVEEKTHPNLEADH